MDKLFLFSALLLNVACVGKNNDADTGQDTGDDSGIVDTGSFIPDNFELNLTFFDGCADYFIYGKNTDDSIALHISGTGLAQAAHDAGEAVTVVHDLNVDSDTNPPVVKVLLGQNLNYESCNDALDPNIVVAIDSEYVAVTGELTLTALPSGEATSWGEVPAQVEALLRGVTLCADGSVENCVHIDSLDVVVDVGWLPG